MQAKVGYFFDPAKRRMEYGSHPDAAPTVEDAMGSVAYQMSPANAPQEMAPSSQIQTPTPTAQPTTASKVGSGAEVAGKAVDAVSKVEAGGNPDSAAGDLLMASPDPYMKAAGAAFKVAGSVNEGRYKDAVKRRESIDSGLGRAASLASKYRI